MSNFVDLTHSELVEVDGGIFVKIGIVAGAVIAIYGLGALAGEIFNRVTPTCPDCGGNHWW